MNYMNNKSRKCCNCNCYGACGSYVRIQGPKR